MMPQLSHMPQLGYGNTSGGRLCGGNVFGQASSQFQETCRNLRQPCAEQEGTCDWESLAVIELSICFESSTECFEQWSVDDHNMY